MLLMLVLILVVGRCHGRALRASCVMDERDLALEYREYYTVLHCTM